VISDNHGSNVRDKKAADYSSFAFQIAYGPGPIKVRTRGFESNSGSSGTRVSELYIALRK
jgi:hypothetical protein